MTQSLESDVSCSGFIPFIETEVITGIIAKNVDVFDLDGGMQPIAINTELNKEGSQFFVRDYDGNLVELVDAGNKFFNPDKPSLSARARRFRGTVSRN